jgi:hypothetical protein
MPALNRPRRVLVALLGLAGVGLGLGLHITAKAHDAATSTSANATGPAIAYITLPTPESPKLISVDINGSAPQNLQASALSTPAAPERIPAVVDESGPVQTSPQIYVVFVGSYWQGGRGSQAATSMSQVLSFYQHVGASRYNQTLAQYRGAGTNAQLVRAWIDPDAMATTLDPVVSLPSIVSAAKIPTGTQTQVNLIYPPGSTFTIGSERDAVGYHSWADGVAYAAISSVPGYAGSLMVTASHEYDETVSDPISTIDPSTGLANHAFGFAASSTSPTIFEVADVCQNQEPAISDGIALARMYDLKTGTCVAPPLNG